MRILKTFSIVALLTLVFFILISTKSNIEKSDVFISKDYSMISYYGEIFVPIAEELLPYDLAFPYEMAGINADVEGENWFLDNFFFTDYVFYKEHNGEKFIFLNTDYDVNESDYYCLPSYKERLIKEAGHEP